MAIEDGYVLARLLSRHGEDVETALQAYPAERKPRTDWITLQSREQFANNTKVPPPPFLDRTWLFVNDVMREEGCSRPRQRIQEFRTECSGCGRGSTIAINTCGIFAHRAIAPTKKLLAAARRAYPDLLLHPGDPPEQPAEGAVSTRAREPCAADGFAIYHEFPVQPEDIVITKQRASIFQGTPLFSHLSPLGIQSLIVCGESTSGLRARQRRRRPFERFSRLTRRGMHLRSAPN